MAIIGPPFFVFAPSTCARSFLPLSFILPPLFSETTTAVLQHALALPPPHPAELYIAAIRCFSVLGIFMRAPKYI
jgi:hypothetical protein